MRSFYVSFEAKAKPASKQAKSNHLWSIICDIGGDSRRGEATGMAAAFRAQLELAFVSFPIAEALP
jgi:hypothetical protein